MTRIVIAVIIIFFTPGLYAHVGLIYPTGERAFSQGEEINIQWEVIIPHNTLNWDLYFSSDGGNSWETIQLDIPAASLTFRWIVPNVSTINAVIKVVQENSDSHYEDISNSFTILGSALFSGQAEYMVKPPFPNPFCYSTTFTLRNAGKIPYLMNLFNEKGQLVKSYADIDSDQFMLYRNDLPVGIYYFQLYSEKRYKVSTGKLLVR